MHTAKIAKATTHLIKGSHQRLFAMSLSRYGEAAVPGALQPVPGAQ
jgi:hypothetical protein